MRKTSASFFVLFSLLIGLLFWQVESIKQSFLISPQNQFSDLAAEAVPLSQTETNLIVKTSDVEEVPEDQVLSLVAVSNEPLPTPIPEPEMTPTPEPVAVVPVTTPSPKPKPPTPIPTASPIVATAKAPEPQTAPPGSLDGDKIFRLVNEYRASKNLPILEKDQRSCDLAASRAPEIMDEVRSGTMHKGLADRKLPYWNNENIAYYNTEEETVNWWIADTIHRKQLEGNFKYSCAVCYKNACAEELTNFSPK